MSARTDIAAQAVMNQPRPLPYCSYPGAANVAQHGVQPLPPAPAGPCAGARRPLADTVASPDGFLSAKDSGSMLYVIRLA
jgi:hypothetical protein